LNLVILKLKVIAYSRKGFHCLFPLVPKSMTQGIESIQFPKCLFK